MADLIAQGEHSQDRWRRVLPLEQRLVLGRVGTTWSVPWDEHVSREHVRLKWNGRRLEVERVESARNPVFFRGKPTERCAVAPGEHFVIGSTRFVLVEQRVHIAADAPMPAQQQAFSSQHLRDIRFGNPDHRLEVLCRLPQALSEATGHAELGVALVSMLLAGIPRADTAAVVQLEPEPPGDSSKPVARGIGVIHWDQRLLGGGDFQPSQRLIQEAVRRGQSVLYVWEGREGDPQLFTARHNVDWAFCTPVLGPATPDWAIYVDGSRQVDAMPGSSEVSDTREDVKFAELIAGSVGSLQRMRALERQQATLSQFLSPVVLESLSTADPDVVLAPKETEVSVLFCDLRGFSRQTERHADELIEMLGRVSKALGVMTRHILKTGGVVGDFHGDAAMGFWGWPLSQDDSVLRTCRAAMGIRRQFETAAGDEQSRLAGFNVGIGVATGPAVAGKIGTIDQVKVTVFGPVVNLASRLEGMTKILRAPILLDQTTASAVRREVPADVARVRRLAVIRPYGLTTPIEVSELLPPQSDDSVLTDEHLKYSEAALDAFLAGRWSEAMELLHRTPPEDAVTDFLTVYIAQHNRTPPPDWDGLIELTRK